MGLSESAAMKTKEPAVRAPLFGWSRGAALVVLIACLWVIVANITQGPLLSQDSESYLLLAQSLAEHGQYALPHVETSPRALVYGRKHSPAPWPPGYPALTALLSVATRLPLPVCARLLALLATVACVLLTAVLARRLGCSDTTAALAALTFAVAPATVMVAPYLWSELLCTVPVLLALILLASNKEPTDRRALLLGLCAAAACLVRYNGVTLVAALALAILIQERREPFGRLVRHLLLVAGLPALAMGAWLVRNRLVTGSFETFRGPGTESLFRNLLDAAKSLVLTFAGTHPANIPVAALLALCLIPLVALALKHWRSLPDRRSLLPAALVLSFPFVHILLLAVLRTFRDFDPLGPRLLWPALPAIVAVAAAVLQPVLKSSPTARALLVATLALVLCGSLLTARESITQVTPQMRQEAQQRAEVAQSPQLRPIVQGKRVLVVETWPMTIAQAGQGAAELWGSSPYAFGVHHFDQPGPWRDWLKRIDAIIAIDPVTFNSPEWSPRPLPNGAVIYIRHSP